MVHKSLTRAKKKIFFSTYVIDTTYKIRPNRSDCFYMEIKKINDDKSSKVLKSIELDKTFGTHTINQCFLTFSN